MMNNFKRWLLIFSASFTLYEVLWFVIELQFTTFSINWAETGWDALMCMIFTSVVFGINSFFAKFRNGRYAQTVWEVAGLLLSNILMIFAVDNLLYIQDTNDDKLWSIIDIYIICLICSMFSILNFQKVYHKKLIAVKEEQLKLRLNLLQQQLSPHFMFNSLSVLQGLITIDSEKAEKYVDTLSDLMRYITQNVGKDKTTLLAGDRGYRGKKEINGTKIMIPDAPKKSDSRYQRLKKHMLFCKRVGIEPTIGHLKSDYRLGRNFYKGVVGDAVNVLLSAAAYNFKRAMKALLGMLQKICEILYLNNISQKWAF